MVIITPCFQEWLPFVHQNMSFLALREYASFASAGASVSHGHILVSTGSTLEDPSQHDWKIVDWYIKKESTNTFVKLLSKFKRGLFRWTITKMAAAHGYSYWLRSFITQFLPNFIFMYRILSLISCLSSDMGFVWWTITKMVTFLLQGIMCDPLSESDCSS